LHSRTEDGTAHNNLQQDDTMNFGGYLGQIEFSGPLDEFLPYLALVGYLHLGSHCNFGLGAFELHILE